MPLFDALQNLFDGASEIAQNTVGDALSGITELPVVQDVQDLTGGVEETITGATESLSETVTNVTDQAQTVIEDVTNGLGL